MSELSLNNCRLDRRYDVLEILGRGSYAEIYLARDSIAGPQSPHHQVVIKALNVFMQNDLDADLERTLVENFQNEAIALDRVRHPNVVSRLGHGTARDLRGQVFHYLVLEFLAGGDLAKFCREKTLSFDHALNYIEQVCAGLAHAHQHGVIHRDIKPQNLLLNKELTTVKIADFGVARFAQSDSPITRVGTNVYAPPEHSPLLSENGGTMTVTELTPAADIYSLAKSVYVLLTRESPRFFTNQPITELPFAVRQEVWASELLKILHKATQTDPRARHQSVNEFWLDLVRLKTLATSESGEIATRVAVRQSATPKAHVARGYTPLAPQKPKFNTSRELKFRNNQISAKDPLVVIRLDEPQNFANLENSAVNKFPAIQNQPLPNMPKPQPLVVENSQQSEPERIENFRPRKKSFLRRAVFLLFLIGIFSGVLIGTHFLLRGLGNLTRFGSILSSREGRTVLTMNLREDSNLNASVIGNVPANSRIRIVGETDRWFQIEVIEYGSPKQANWAERGWISKRAEGQDSVDFSR